MRPILLISSVCALLLLLNSDKFDIKCDKSGSKGFVSSNFQPKRHESGSASQISIELTGYQSSGQSSGQCYKGFQGVSSIYRPKRHESGSYVQFSNPNSKSTQITGCIFNGIFNFSRGLFHELFTSHVSKLKFSIVNNSVTVAPSSILSLICDHKHVKHVKHVKLYSIGLMIGLMIGNLLVQWKFD